MPESGDKAVSVVIRGRVQGVGFRYWVREAAAERGLVGWVRNRADGDVEALFAGSPERLEDMLEACWRGPRFSSVTSVEARDGGGDEVPPIFEIRR